MGAHRKPLDHERRLKTLEHRIREVAKEQGLGQLVVERDYAQSYVLLGIAATEVLCESLMFKGGTALKKVHLGNYRFSEDLDFSAVNAPKGKVLEEAVRRAMALAQNEAQRLSPLTFSVERYEEREPHPGGQEVFIVRAQFPWQRKPMVPVKLEVTHDEPVLLDCPRLAVGHGYGEELTLTVRAYCLEEVCAEKIRSTRQTQAKMAKRGWARPRARDFYDLWHLVRLDAGRINWSTVSAVLPKKCAARQVSVTGIDDIFAPALLDEVRASWVPTLGPFVNELPKVELVLGETRERLQALLKF